ncbi:13793_t:CDS:2, partial [Rhizophagus irregularis]
MSRRKRSVSALLSNDEESITARSSRKNYSNPLPSSFEDYSNPLPSSSEDYGNSLPEDNPVLSDKDSDNNQNVIQRMEIEEIDDLSTDLLHRQ